VLSASSGSTYSVRGVPATLKLVRLAGGLEDLCLYRRRADVREIDSQGSVTRVFSAKTCLRYFPSGMK
jgi:hypothetical protein